MKQENILKILGIIIVVVMALSMLAAGMLYATNDTSANNGSANTSDDFPLGQTKAYNYSVSFDTNVLKELRTVRLATFTTSLDKAKIDAQVLKVDGVSKVTSQFVKNDTDSNAWTYLAEVSLKTSAVPASVTASIFDLNDFISSRKDEFSAIKYVTIAAPKSTIIHNIDLNVDRNYSFDTSTISAMANVATAPGDEVLMGGSMTLQGKTVTSLSLVERLNLTQQRILQQMFNDANKTVTDTNTPDANSN